MPPSVLFTTFKRNGALWMCLIYDIMFIEAQQILRHAAANVVKQSK